MGFNLKANWLRIVTLGKIKMFFKNRGAISFDKLGTARPVAEGR